MKFYVYIADAKLDAFLGELAEEDRERIARALDFDPALLGTSETPRGAPDELRFARAAAVAHELERTGRSAALSADGGSAPYVADLLELHWGRLRHMRGAELLIHETESPVAFMHSAEAAELVMVGSASHLLAQPPKATVDHAAASRPDDSSWFAPVHAQVELDAIDRRCLEYVFDDTWPVAQTAEAAGWPNEAKPLEPWMERLARVRRELRALPGQRLEIVAKRVVSFERRVWHPTSGAFEPESPVVFAAPLSVAMVV